LTVMTNLKPCDMTINEASKLIARGKLSSTELVKSCLERTDANEGKIKAWALLDREGALMQAAALDAETRVGRRRGPLHGIPFGIKDIFYTAGMRTEAGSKSWAGFVPSFDSTAVARLKAAGAVIMGKTHTTEFAFMDPALTTNPWNPEHTPGGSSSGSGAGVAAGMCLAALGSQTGGSTLRPAAFNGIVGLKAEHGRISTYGVAALSWRLDHVGILARSVADAALILQVLAGYDPADAYSLNAPVPDMSEFLGSVSPPHLGLAKGYFFEHADEEMRRNTEAVAEKLARAGAVIEEVIPPPGVAATSDLNEMIMKVEAAAYHKEMFAAKKELYGQNIRRRVEEGLVVPATDYAAALRARGAVRNEMAAALAKVDAWLTPGAPGEAPLGLKSTGSSVMQRPWSTSGFPSVGIPTGLSKNGLPLAVQLGSVSMTEAKLLGIARWCEDALDVHLKPPVA
jgi:Asp-tRNA(Asn)/Glu-tRNA(Gln) amidotransferase A subunit family amidase